jgi:IS30 family transposase
LPSLTTSWERGANENLKGLIRQYFPKKSNVENITKQEIESVINILNTRPRKRFGYKTPGEIFAEKLNELDLCCIYQLNPP